MTNEERIAALQVKVDHLDKTLDAATKKIDDMHDMLMRADGAKWVLIGLASLAGFMAGWAHKLLPFLGGPR